MIQQEGQMSGWEKMLGVDRSPPDINLFLPEVAKERMNRTDWNTIEEQELKSGVVWVQRDRVFSRKLQFKNLKF